jgi:hypothetical protein
LAAGEFSNAAKGITSAEALRTLQLLEKHHEKIAELLKYTLEHPVQPDSDFKEAEQKATQVVGSETESKAPKGGQANIAQTKSSSATGHIPQQRRYPPSRELSSSIASNLASARGIRSKQHRGQPVAPSVSTDQAPGNLDVRKDGSRSQMQSMLHQKGKPSWVPPASVAGEPAQAERSTMQETIPSQPEEGVSRFYSTFGSIINRLSAPLAFAGLPLITEESITETSTPVEPSPKRVGRPNHRQTASPEPEVSKIYSHAALGALSHPANDSFYVVPKTGHTVSYAGILNFDQKEKRRMAASIHSDAGFFDDDDDDFVDARETPVPLSPVLQRRIGKGRSEKDFRNAIEELQTENENLKSVLDRVSTRLHAFEAQAQNSHMALQESMRLLRPGSPLSSSGAGKVAPGDDALVKKNKELEEQLRLALQQLEMSERDRSRMEKNLESYREKWERLKAGARARREAQGSSADSPRTPI